MGKKLKKYVVVSIIKTIMLYTIITLILTIIGICLIPDIVSLFFFGLDIICIIMLMYKIYNYILNIKNIKLNDFKKIEKELLNPILIKPFNYILTDTYIINLKNSHLFKYEDIETMYKKVGFSLRTKHLHLGKYLCIITKDKKKDKFFIGYVGNISNSFYDFSNIIMKKNIWVNFSKDGK
ncbi:MAG: hypothetical protein IKN63_06170 [Bacilli bacterium]|nr:hypothetical protein [Bacilli bacterium]